MNSGHVQTESYRMGLHGPYTMTWSRSGTPKLPVWTFRSSPVSPFKTTLPTPAMDVSRNRLRVASRKDTVLHWYHSAVQCWTYASSSASFTSPLMKPGIYTMVLYQTELKVASTSITVSAGSTTSKDITSTLTSHSA